MAKGRKIPCKTSQWNFSYFFCSFCFKHLYIVFALIGLHFYIVNWVLLIAVQDTDQAGTNTTSFQSGKTKSKSDWEKQMHSQDEMENAVQQK